MKNILQFCVFERERERQRLNRYNMQIKENKNQSQLISFICSVFHNWMFLPKFRNILVYCRYRAVIRCLLSLHLDMTLLQYSCLHFLLTSREMVQRNSWRKWKKIRKCMSYIFLVTCCQIGCQWMRSFFHHLISGHLQHSNTHGNDVQK